MDYGKAIQGVRVESGLSQAELASRARVSASYVVHMEAGRRKPSLDVLEAVAEALGVSLLVLVWRAASYEERMGRAVGQR